MRARTLVATLMLLAAAAPAFAIPPLPQPKLLAVYFWADWCVNCKTLSPAIREARAHGGLDDKDVLFVTFDLTDATTIHQSILEAQAMGIGPYLRAQGSSTGYIAILDAKSKKELTRFDRANKPKEIEEGIDKLLASAK